MNIKFHLDISCRKIVCKMDYLLKVLKYYEQKDCNRNLYFLTACYLVEEYELHA